MIITNAFFSFDNESYFEPYTYYIDPNADILILNADSNLIVMAKKIFLNIKEENRLQFRATGNVTIKKANLEII